MKLDTKIFQIGHLRAARHDARIGARIFNEIKLLDSKRKAPPSHKASFFAPIVRRSRWRQFNTTTSKNSCEKKLQSNTNVRSHVDTLIIIMHLVWLPRVTRVPYEVKRGTRWGKRQVQGGPNEGDLVVSPYFRLVHWGSSKAAIQAIGV